MGPSTIFAAAEDSDDYDALSSVTGRDWHGYPYPRKPVPVFKDKGFSELGSNAYAGIPPCQPRNLAMAEQVSTDTAVRHCEVGIRRQGFGTSPTLWSFTSSFVRCQALVVGKLMGIIHTRACVFAWAGGRIHVRVCISH